MILLQVADKIGTVEEVAIAIEECGGLDVIETLQSHDNEKVYEKAFAIIEKYFSEVCQQFTLNCYYLTSFVQQGEPEDMQPQHVNSEGQIDFNPTLSTNCGFKF